MSSGKIAGKKFATKKPPGAVNIVLLDLNRGSGGQPIAATDKIHSPGRGCNSARKPVSPAQASSWKSATPLEAERNPKVREEAISSPKPASRSLPPQRYRPRPVVQSRPGSQTPKSLDV
jgi:hypothetical protein